MRGMRCGTAGGANPACRGTRLPRSPAPGLPPLTPLAAASVRAGKPRDTRQAISAKLKAALNGIWGPLLGFSEESLFPDFDGFALAHGVDKPFPAGFVMDTAAS